MTRPTTPGQPPAPADPPLHILVAEDNHMLRQLSERMVTRLGHTVAGVTTGAEAVEAVLKGDFDVVLMDMRMPVMDGLDATRHIRSVGTTIRQPRIVAVTAGERLRDWDACLAAGMDDYLTKPFTCADLERAFTAGLATTPPPIVASVRRFGHLDELGAEAKSEILQAVVTRGNADVVALQQALADGDHQTLRFLAHRLRGGGLAIGASDLAAAALKLERAPGREALNEELVTAVSSAYLASVRDIELETHAVAT